ncbi:quinolinate synthase [candidate division LCP-89 bacterium B3_LCP]|uniref:Quinolinate synthase n=1 Tax=candidate division LCP-89 bacterium B3_LCP TaxID=2012998 RepID=A0A532V433_UNCL8|nr:MAG: quinolinate synthase [candidate division LCP-89 bacterium B3_LCP]
MDVREYSTLPVDELVSRIKRAKKKKNAVLLVHNYQRMEVQQLADFLGDSLGLAREATRTDADIIVFCGVDFMAETAKILNPDKKVLLPDHRADCPMARMIDAPLLTEAKRKYPGAVVVTYVNSTAEVKALSDICCTSSNAIKVVKSLGDKQIIFTPDKNLAEYCRQHTGADIIPWEGHCYVHDQFTTEDVKIALEMHPDAIFIAHPECRMEVLSIADHVASTTGMVNFVTDNQDEIREKGIIIGTEIGLVEQINTEYPDLPLYPLTSTAICATQKLTNLAKVAWCIETQSNEIILDEEVRCRAYGAVKRMIDIS